MPKTKTGGRQIGTPNKVTTDLRSLLKEIVSEELDHLQSHIQEMPDEQRTQILLKLLPYVTPKTQAITYTEDKPIRPLFMKILGPGEDITEDIEAENDFVVKVVNGPSAG
jgi:DNA topoisomerase VI subunit B